MTKEQYRRANGTVFPVTIITLGYFVFSMVAWMFSRSASWRTYLQMGVSILAILVCLIMFLTKRETKQCAVIMMGSAAMAYVVICLVGTTSGTWAYVFPVLFAAMAFLNIRLIAIGNTVAVTAAILRLIITYTTTFFFVV